ncbi:MAG: YfiR family protein [Vicinamibacterales bacterium]
MDILIRRGAIALLVASIHAALSPAAAQTRAAAENDVKAVFLYNFGKYVEWPATAFQEGPHSPLNVCVMADEAFRQSVERAIADETVRGRPMTLSIPGTPAATAGCHILFIGKTEGEATRLLLKKLAGSGTLTVGDSPEFLRLGGAIAFVLDQDRVRFDVNRAAAAEQGVTISAKLLRVARRVMER